MNEDFTHIEPWTYTRDGLSGYEYWTYLSSKIRDSVIVGRQIGKPETTYALYNNRDVPLTANERTTIPQAKKRALESIETYF